MAEWYDDADENEGEDPRETNPKSLRNQLRKVLADNAELKTKNSELQADLRKSNISGFFRDKGINPKLAKYVPADIDPTPETLSKWVEEDGELFNISLTPKAAEGGTEKPAEGTESTPGTETGQESPQGDSGASFAEQWNKISGTTASAMPPGREADLLTQITSATDLEQLQKVIFSHGGGSEF